MNEPPELSAAERARYEWQMWVDGFGERGQRQLKQARVLVTRVGGVGGAVAYQLAAAGVGKLVLAHAGDIRPSDLNRQLLMTEAGLGSSRVESAARRLRELNSGVEIVAIAENVNEQNVRRIVDQVDLVVDGAPLFHERFLLNRACVEQRKPLVDCAMYEFDCQLTTILPGRTACLACIFPQPPAYWQREFPVFGAVAGVVGSLAAAEAIKVLAEVGEPLFDTLLACSLRTMHFVRTRVTKNPDCVICSHLGESSSSSGAPNLR